MARLFTTAGVLALVIALTVSVAAAQEDDVTTRAKERFQTGVADFEAGRYEAALAAFQEAHRLKPHPMVQVNMANCYDKLDRPVEAIFHFEQVLESGSATPEQKKDITAAIRRLKKRVSDVSFNVSPDGAIVVIDDGEQRRAPIVAPIRLVAGTHKLEVHLEGYRSEERTFHAAGGKAGEVAVTLQPVDQAAVVAVTPLPEPTQQAEAEPVAEPVPAEAEGEATPPQVVDASTVVPIAEPATEPAPSGGGGIPTSAWVVGGVGAALLVAAGISGLIAKGAESSFEDSRQQYLARKDNPSVSAYVKVQLFDIAVDDAERAETLAVTTDVLLVGALVSAGLAVYLYASADDSGERADLQLAPTLARDGAGIWLGGAL